jgi:hypothetical protein
MVLTNYAGKEYHHPDKAMEEFDRENETLNPVDPVNPVKK